MSTLDYLKENISDVTFGMTLLEGIGCTYAQTAEILERGTSNGVSPNDIQKILNFKHALDFMQDNCRYPVELGTLMEYNAIVGFNDDTHPNPGYVRDDRDVRISGCSYVAPAISEYDALAVVNSYQNYNDVFDQFAYLAVELPKRQLFCNGNKRTALLACNHLLCYNDAGYIFAIGNDEEYDSYIHLLLSYYEDRITLEEAMEQVKCFLH